ncbi:hypothetical protein KW782_01025 [Candidatus Parcubacteria bacterium]|nr:hypothetical protein [Candidatus Parcubacteria bacterium]
MSEEIPQSQPSEQAIETGESKIERMRRMRDEILEKVRTTVRERFEKEHFHNPEHPMNVDIASSEVFAVFKKHDGHRVTEEADIIRKIITESHDLVVRYVLDVKTGTRIRQRGTRFGEIPAKAKTLDQTDDQGNEQASIKELIEIIKEVDPTGEIFTPEIYQIITEGINATYPEGRKDGKLDELSEEELKKITDPETGQPLDFSKFRDAEGKFLNYNLEQPYLKGAQYLSTVATAIGDLSYVGRVSFEKFKKFGDAEYRETREKTTYELTEKDKDLPIEKRIQALSPERKAEIAKDMIYEWVKLQPGFAISQKIRFKDIVVNENDHTVIDDVVEDAEKSKKIKDELDSIYNEFDPNIIGATKRFERLEAAYSSLIQVESFVKNPDESNKLFIDLARDMGYSF